MQTIPTATAKEDLPDDAFVIELSKEPGSGFGLNFAGGKTKEEADEHGYGVIIAGTATVISFKAISHAVLSSMPP